MNLDIWSLLIGFQLGAGVVTFAKVWMSRRELKRLRRTGRGPLLSRAELRELHIVAYDATRNG